MRLEHEHFLRILPNHGYFVSHITLPLLNEIHGFRLAVECAAAALAATKARNSGLFDRRLQLARTTRYVVGDRASHERFIVADTESHV